MLAASDNFVIDTITDIIYKTCNNGDIGENLSRFFYIALAENPGANECEIHRSLNPMNHIKKNNHSNSDKESATRSSTRAL